MKSTDMTTKQVLLQMYRTSTGGILFSRQKENERKLAANSLVVVPS